ncbi:MAG: bifunctional oligoribonuclease/PAP phosphatase NrnA, partial [Tidjanibacter sp.]|nr:bifunctional oligoribonuclease/PAP phosphatase NrnA [Tidjanibacter sp.]
MVEFFDKIERLKEYLAGAPKRIVTVTHTNPDGDAIGSSLAWAEVLRKLGHSVSCLVPNRHPAFLDWMPGIGQMIVAKEMPDEAAKAVAEAE